MAQLYLMLEILLKQQYNKDTEATTERVINNSSLCYSPTLLEIKGRLSFINHHLLKRNK